MWYNTLVPLETGIDHIKETLMRSLILRRFNKDACGMEIATGSDLQRIVGLGDKYDGSGRIVSMDQALPSHWRDVCDAFRYYPIAQTFGITTTQAMELPLDQWYHLVKVSREIAREKAETDNNSELLQVIKLLLQSRGVDE